jgi:hypothetical protein
MRRSNSLAIDHIIAEVLIDEPATVFRAVEKPGTGSASVKRTRRRGPKSLTPRALNSLKTVFTNYRRENFSQRKAVQQALRKAESVLRAQEPL